MSFLWLRYLLLPIALALPMLAGACAAPVAVTAGSTAADAGSMAETGKSTTDHLASMVSKRDCALFRVFQNQSICRDRDSDHDPYNVNYNEPFRAAGEGGVEYTPPLHPAANTPSQSWSASAYEASAVPSPPSEAASAPAAPVADATPPQPAKMKKLTPSHSAKHKKAKVKPKPSPDPAAPPT